MKMRDAPDDTDPLVLEASFTGDDVDLVLTRKGYEAMEEAVAMLRVTNPKATYKDALKWMLGVAIEELEAELEARAEMN